MKRLTVRRADVLALVVILAIVAAGGAAYAQAAKKGAAKAAPAPADTKAPDKAAAKTDAAAEKAPMEKEMRVSLEDIKEASTEKDVLAEQMETLEEGDQKEYRIVTDDSCAGLAVGDIYKSGSSFFKVKKIRKAEAKGGVFVVQRIRGKIDPTMKWSRVSGEGPLTVMSRETLMDRYWVGGICMHPIAFLMFLEIVLIIRSLFYYREKVHCPAGFAEQCRQALADRDVARFGSLAEKQKGLLGHIARVTRANMEKLTEDELKSRVEAETVHELGRMYFPLRLMNFVSVAAPLFGLLGTVTGIISCFESLAGEMASQAKATKLAGGIKEALYTTAFGLFVAIPTVGIYMAFNHRLNQIANLCAVTAEEWVHEIGVLHRIELLEEGGKEGGTGESASS